MAEDIEEVVETETNEEKKGSAPSQGKPKRTEAETTAFNLKKQAEKAKELGLDPTEILGIKSQIKLPEDETLDDQPLTRRDLRNIQKEDVKKTSLELADQIEDETEREETKRILNRLEPSGDAQRDFAIAHSAVTADRTKKVAKVAAQSRTASRTAAGGTQPGKAEDDFEPTADELVFMRPPYNLSKEKIIAKRQAEQQ